MNNMASMAVGQVPSSWRRFVRTSLGILWIDDTRVTKAGVAELKQALPQASIMWE